MLYGDVDEKCCTVMVNVYKQNVSHSVSLHVHHLTGHWAHLVPFFILCRPGLFAVNLFLTTDQSVLSNCKARLNLDLALAEIGVRPVEILMAIIALYIALCYSRCLISPQIWQRSTLEVCSGCYVHLRDISWVITERGFFSHHLLFWKEPL